MTCRRLRWAAGLIVVVVLCNLSVAGRGDGEDSPEDEVVPEPGVRIDRGPIGVRVEVVFPGRLISYALPRGPGGKRELIALIAPAPESEPDAGGGSSGEKSTSNDGESGRRLPPCPARSEDGDEVQASLYRVDTSDGGELIRIRGDLPGDATALDSADLDGDGREELLLARPTELSVIQVADNRRVVLEHPDFRWESVSPRPDAAPDLAGRAVATALGLGVLRVYTADPGAEPWTTLAEVEIPRTGSIRNDGIHVQSQRVRFVGLEPDGTMVFTTIPRAVGKQRVQTTLIEVGPDGVFRVVDCWGRFPESEDVLESFTRMLDDRPVALVTTKPANKLNLFGEKRIRVYPLASDRSRLGLEPLVAMDSRMNLWQDAVPMFLDVDDDGRRDLVIGYWKGLKDDKVVLDVYLREEDGSFQDKARSTGFDVEDGDRSFLDFGRDLDGDGHSELVVRSGSELVVYRGQPSSNAKKLLDPDDALRPIRNLGESDYHTKMFVSSDGTQRFRTYSVNGRPAFADLDGDGRDDIFVFHRGNDDRYTVLHIVRLARTAGSSEP